MINSHSNVNSMLYICSCKYHPLINLPNVQGVGVGFKEINGEATDKLCIQVLVSEKLDSNSIKNSDKIPATYMGFETDVVAVGSPRALSLKNKIRPLQAGYAVSPATQRDYTGSIGCIVEKGTFSKEYFILSSNHVLSAANKFRIGYDIVQPAAEYGGEAPSDSVARLYKTIPLQFITTLHKPQNTMDCAIAKLNNKSLASHIIAKIGKVKGSDAPVIRSTVRKVGCATDLTSGAVSSFGITIKVKYDDGKEALFVNQLRAKVKCSDGDSGSAIVNQNSKVVGLLVAGDDEGGCIFSSIKPILKALDVKIYT